MKRIHFLAAVAIALTACNNDIENPDTYSEPLLISASINENSASRASNDKWSPGDKIGITLASDFVNMEYTTEDGEGEFTGKPIYLKNNANQVDFTAYYPFTGTEGTAPGIISANTSAAYQTDAKQPLIDFLFAQAKNETGKHPKVTFTFAHKMSKVTLIFNNGTGTDVSEISSYTIAGLALDGTFDTATGACAASDDHTGTLALTTETSLILFPQSVQKVTLKITDSNGQNYACDLNFKDNELTSGNNYQFTITVNKNGLTVNESGIIDWGTPVENSTDAGAVDPE